MSLQDNAVHGIEKADADANLQYGISLLHPSLVTLIQSNPITAKKMGNKKKDFSQSLQAIINDWSLFYPAESKFVDSKKYFLRAKKVRNWVAHQSLDSNRYQHFMECLAKVATSIGKPDFAEIILNLVLIEDDDEEENGKVNVASSKKDDWESIKQDGNQFYKQKRWREAMNCYTRAIHLNQGEAVLYSNRALCELLLSRFDLAREDIEDAIQLDPKNVKYFRILSEVLLKLKMHQESLATCLRGLKIDPRDEVLNVRERDCRALIKSDITDKNPAFGRSTVGRTLEKIDDKFVKKLVLYMCLKLTSEDIEDCPNLDELIKRSQLSKPIGEAHQYEHGEAATHQGSQAKAFAIFEAAAKKGSAEGLYNVARFYSEGKAGLPRDFHKAMELCRKAACQKAFFRFYENILPNVGVAEAEAFLGNCYRDGRGVEQCSTEAFKWYLKAARHDCPTAQNNLGLALLNGDGCKKNEASARSWFRNAADHGLGEGQYNYAMVLEEGRGGHIDCKKAAELLQLCADQCTPGALERLQNLSMSGALGGSTIEQTKESLKKAAKKGDLSSIFLLGQNYLNGSGGFVKDLRQAERLLREASKIGHADAYLPLGKLLLELKKNEEALEFVKLSAEKGSTEGQFELGTLFAYGHGCTRDEGKARRWLNRAKQQGISFKPIHPDREEAATEDWVEKEIDYGRETSEFETQQHLKFDGMSIQERKRRFITSELDLKDPASSSFLKLFNAFPPGERAAGLSPKVQSIKGFNQEFINELVSRAQRGSTTAQSFFESCKMLDQAIDSLKQKRTINDAFKLFRLSQRTWDLPIMEYSGFYMECIRIAKKALDQNSQNSDALYVLARIDMTQSNEEKLRMVKRCVELDPSIPDFHHLFACMLGFVKEHKNALRALDRAIELLPNHPDWLYDRATFIRLNEDSEDWNKRDIDAAEAYLKFISSNPMDHRKFPEACYCLAQIYFLTNDDKRAKLYYQKAVEAEDPRIRLPCFKPVDDSFPAKMITKMLLKTSKGKKMPLEKATDDAVTTLKKLTINNCANCLKSDQSLRCTACKSVWYCDRACQVAHWKKHKVDCKRLNTQN